jgi:hypothetical protein
MYYDLHIFIATNLFEQVVVNTTTTRSRPPRPLLLYNRWCPNIETDYVISLLILKRRYRNYENDIYANRV